MKLKLSLTDIYQYKSVSEDIQIEASGSGGSYQLTTTDLRTGHIMKRRSYKTLRGLKAAVKRQELWPTCRVCKRWLEQAELDAFGNLCGDCYRDLVSGHGDEGK